ncbi:hypothetical protein ACX8Z9_09125 [Arthrobacter halodurans]|uniref:Uncharacterized protein n=1 Tax=Arthrobacter halodurans TaxID=516699 RepID=A0ABV4UM37_9MICC
MNRFDLRPDPSGGFDFLVDGRFLRELVFEGEDMQECEVSLLRRGLPSGVAREQIRRLKGELPGQFFPERVWLYFCEECYDEGCGGISARVQVGSERVVWSDFRHDSPSDTDDEAAHFDDEDAIPAVGTLVFDRVEYEAALDRVAEQLGRSFVAFWRSTDALNQATLGLERVVSRRQLRKRSPDPREGLQWTVNGRPLARLLSDAAGTLSRTGPGLQSDLRFSVVQECRDSSAEVGRNAIRLLLGEGTWEELPGRVPLLVGEGLDVACGSITAHVDRLDSIVVWSGFRVHGAGPEGDGHPYDRKLTFTFDRRQHDETLRRVVERI